MFQPVTRRSRVFGHRPHLLNHVLSLVVLAVAAACLAPGDSATEHTAAPTQPPPPAVLASSLVDTHWRLEQAFYQGQALTFNAAGPIHLTFGRAGGLEVSSRSCGRGDYVVAYLGGSRYQLASPSFLELTCRDRSRAQLYAVVDALEGTGAYAVQAGELILRGPDAELRLGIEKP